MLVFLNESVIVVADVCGGGSLLFSFSFGASFFLLSFNVTCP